MFPWCASVPSPSPLTLSGTVSAQWFRVPMTPSLFSGEWRQSNSKYWSVCRFSVITLMLRLLSSPFKPQANFPGLGLVLKSPRSPNWGKTYQHNEADTCNVVCTVQCSQECTYLYAGETNNLSINEWHNTGWPTRGLADNNVNIMARDGQTDVWKRSKGIHLCQTGATVFEQRR